MRSLAQAHEWVQVEVYLETMNIHGIELEIIRAKKEQSGPA